MNTDTIIYELGKEIKKVGVNMNVLIVEDDTTLQVQMQNILSRFFRRVDVANNGLEGLELYKQREYHLIITDLTMPKMDGIEFCQNIRVQNSSQFILVLSAHSESQKLLELINIGIDSFLLKPVNIEQLLSSLHKSCKAIYDNTMKEYYSKMLEETNLQLTQSNQELESALNELLILKDQTLVVDDKHLCSKNLLESVGHDVDSLNEKLQSLADDFNVLLFEVQEFIQKKPLKEFSDLLKSYAELLKVFEPFDILYVQIELVSKSFQNQKNEEEILQTLLPLLILFFDNLEQFRKEIFEYKKSKNIYLVLNKLLTQISNIQTSLYLLKSLKKDKE